MRFELPSLPYAKDALEPHIGAQTLEFHYEKHHRGYLEKLRKAIEGRPLAEEPLEEIVRLAGGSVFNFAAQVWNHGFYWRSMTPKGGATPQGELASAIARDFGSLANFKQQFAEAAKGEFGSGWAWLALDRNDRLRILSSSDADNPLPSSLEPLLTLDVWEHAYYLDYQNERARYVDAFLDHLANWDFAEKNLRDARGR